MTITQNTPAHVGTTSTDQLLVRRRHMVAEGVVELTLQRADGGRLPDWAPGAHIDLILPSGTVRQYSLCGDRWDAHSYRIAVQREIPSEASEKYVSGSAEIHRELHEGTAVRFGGPRNNFRLAPADRYCFIAGGIGITAILPKIDQAQRMGIPWRLLYLGRTSERMAYRDIALHYPDQVTVHTSAEAGRRSIRDWVFGSEAAVSDSENVMVYACGPQTLLDALPIECAGIPEQRLRVERFTNDQLNTTAITTEPYDIVLHRSGRTIAAPGTLSVSEALRGAGINLITSCERGVCGTCEVGVIDGAVDHRDTILDSAEQAENVCMFPCVSRAADRRLILDL